MCKSGEQFPKIFFKSPPNLMFLLGISTITKFLQNLKASAPMYSILEGRFTLTNPLSKKALSQILLTQ